MIPTVDELAATTSPADEPRVALRRLRDDDLELVDPQALRIAELDAAVYGLDSPAARRGSR